MDAETDGQLMNDNDDDDDCCDAETDDRMMTIRVMLEITVTRIVVMNDDDGRVEWTLKLKAH